jgi:DNA-binding IclR family transcriptional regulator
MNTRFAVGDDPYIATTTVTSFRIVDALRRHRGATVAELVDELDLASGTVYKHLNTLRTIQYVAKEGDEYRLGLGFLQLGLTARSQTGLYELTYGTLADLSESTGSVTRLTVPEHGYGVHLLQIVPPGAEPPPQREGDRVHLHASAAGKAILAYQPEDVVESWLADRDLPAVTDATITDPDRLRAELSSTRDRRTARSGGEEAEGWRSVATPITDVDDEAIGAVSVIEPDTGSGKATEMANARNLLGSVASAIENKVRMR